MNVENGIQGNSSMTIGTQLLRVLASLVSLLTVIRGRLLYYVARYGSAEYSALIATESIQSNSRGIMPRLPSKDVSLTYLKSLSSKYDNPDDIIYDIQHGVIQCDQVLLSEWIELTLMAMASRYEPELDLNVMYKGGAYKFHHCISQAKLPECAETILENTH